MGIFGTATMEGTTNTITVVGTDMHGAYASAFVTIQVQDYTPMRRSSITVQMYPTTISIVESTHFLVQIPDNLYYDPLEGGPLIFFASTTLELPLPTWVNFDPGSRTLYGFAPAAPNSVEVEINVMNQISHDYLTFQFNLVVTKNSVPKASILSFSDDVQTASDTYFQYTLPITIFSDKEANKNSSLIALGGNGQPLPSGI